MNPLVDLLRWHLERAAWFQAGRAFLPHELIATVTARFGEVPEAVLFSAEAVARRQIRENRAFMAAGPGALIRTVSPTSAAGDLATVHAVATFQRPDGGIYTRPISAEVGASETVGAARDALVQHAIEHAEEYDHDLLAVDFVGITPW